MGRSRRELLQADLVLAPGNSGGSLADVAGGTVGIVSMILAPGIAMAVPTHVVRRFLANTWAARLDRGARTGA
jgi:S1-C subfamily serine protease